MRLVILRIVVRQFEEFDVDAVVVVVKEEEL